MNLSKMFNNAVSTTGQRILMSIEVPRLKGPAVVLECTHCGYTYATAARAAPRRKCPNCQSGEK